MSLVKKIVTMLLPEYLMKESLTAMGKTHCQIGLFNIKSSYSLEEGLQI
jgi:hypothetical protein